MLSVVRHAPGLRVRARRSGGDDILQIDRSTDGRLLARAVRSERTGARRGYERLKLRSQQGVDDALRRFADDGDAQRLVAALVRVAASFAAFHSRPARPRRRKQRARPVTIVSGGLPTLGKRG